MRVKWPLLLSLLSMSANFVACGPSQVELDDQATQAVVTSDAQATESADLLAATRTQVYVEYREAHPTRTPTEITSSPTATPSPETALPTIAPPSLTPTPTPTIDVGETISLEMIEMVNESDGWGRIGETILITRDGGHSWREASPPENTAEYVEEFGTRLYFEAIDANHAWLVYAPKPFAAIHGCISTDANIWFTTDGGQTWEASQPLMHSIQMDCSANFNMLNPQMGWLRVLGWYSGGGGGFMYQIFKTLDGGSTWSSGASTMISGAEESDWAFIDEETGWQLIDGSFCFACEGTTPRYQITTDGGETWEEHSIPAPLNAPNLFYHPFNPYIYDYCNPYQLNLLTEEIVRLKVACSNRYGEGQEPVDYLFATEDGGITWTTHELPSSSGRMIFFDKHHGLLLGREMWRTEKGGATWERINTVIWDGQFSFIDPWYGWAIAESEAGEIALVVTTNGGETWKILNPVEID